MQDKQLKSGYSKYIPANIKTSGEISEGKTNGVNKEEFKILQDYIYRTIKQISKEILRGNIAVKPYNKNGKKKSKNKKIKKTNTKNKKKKKLTKARKKK